jgi:dienelactone hydrolase
MINLWRGIMRAVRYLIVMALIVCITRAYAQDRLPSEKEYEPPGDKGRVVVIVSGQTGTANYVNYAQDLAEQGYDVVLVDGNEVWTKTGESVLKGVITRAQQSVHAAPGKVAVIGFSLGGGPALAFAARMPDLVSAVVAYYPFTSYITDAVAFVAKIQVPTILLAGGRDTYKNCCTIEMAQKLSAAAKAAERPALLELTVYPSADHGFNLGAGARGSDAADALRRTLGHLRQYLR